MHDGRIVPTRQQPTARDSGRRSRDRAATPAAASPARRTWREAAKMALRSLRGNLFRTVLTLLGIIIGVASVVAMLAIGDGAKQAGARPHLGDGHRPAGGAARRARRALAAATRHAGAGGRRRHRRARQCRRRRARVSRHQVTVRYGSTDYATRSTAPGRTSRRRATGSWRSGIFFTDARRAQLRAGRRARPDRGQEPLPDERRSDRQVHAGQQHPVPGDRRDGRQGRQRRWAATRTTSSSCRSPPARCACSASAIVRSITVQVADVARIDETQEAIRRC